MTTAVPLLKVLLVEDDLGDVALMESAFAGSDAPMTLLCRVKWFGGRLVGLVMLP